MNSKVLSGVLILALLATACISEFNANLPLNDLQILVVEGSIIENTDATFHISKSFSLEDESIPGESFINNANVNIIGSNGYKSPLAINQGQGSYRIPVGKLDDDVEYGIQIEYEGDTYQSTLSKPLYTPDIDSISWIQPDSAGTVFFHVSTHDNADGSRFFMWSYTEDWETNAIYYTTIFFDPVSGQFYEDLSLPYFYCWKTNESHRFLLGSTESLSENRIINQQIYQQGFESDRFSVLYSVTVNQKAISKAAYEYYQNIIKLNEEMGGLFTPQPLEVTGNITCITDPSKKIIGYIETTKNTTQQRIFVYPSQLKRPLIYPQCNSITTEALKLFLEENSFTYTHFYQMGYRPAGETNLEAYPQIIPLEWMPSHCTDCRDNGGSKNKPGFWPNNHE